MISQTGVIANENYNAICFTEEVLSSIFSGSRGKTNTKANAATLLLERKE